MWEWVQPGLSTMVGAGVALLGGIVVARLKMKGSKDYFDDAATKFLVRRLGPAGGFTFDAANTLGKKIGLTEKDTVQLLFLAGFVPHPNAQTWIVNEAPNP
jgi:hypothetical protein